MNCFSHSKAIIYNEVASNVLHVSVNIPKTFECTFTIIRLIARPM
jgi:hypothetical protein